MSRRIFDGVVEHPAGCPRGLTDCGPLSRVSSPNFESFMCCGESTPESRSVPTDCFRLCLKSTHKTGVDLLVNLDQRDVVDTASVLLAALSSASQLEAADAARTGGETQ